MSLSERETDQSAEGSVERAGSPMLESPMSSDDEDAEIVDPDGLDLIGCVGCGESFATIEDLQQHQKDGCTGAALGVSDDVFSNSTADKHVRTQKGETIGNYQLHKSDDSELRGGFSGQSSKSPNDWNTENTANESIARNSVRHEGREFNSNSQGPLSRSE